MWPKKGKNQLIKADPEMTEVIELSDKDLKIETIKYSIIWRKD